MGLRVELLMFLSSLHVVVGFLGGLKHINPNKIVKSVEDAAPQVAHTLEKNPKTLVSDAVSSPGEKDLVKLVNPQGAAMVLKETGQDHAFEEAAKAGKDAKKIAKSAEKDAEKIAKTAGKQAEGIAMGGQVSQVIQGAVPAVAGAVPAVAGPEESVTLVSTTTLPVQTTPAEIGVIDAQKAVDVAIEKASDVLNGPHDDALDPANLGDVQTGLEKARESIEAQRPHVEKTIEIKIPTPKQVQDALEKSNPEVAHAFKSTRPGIKWVQDAIKNNGAGVEKAINGGGVEKVMNSAGIKKVTEVIERTKPEDIEEAPNRIKRVVQRAKDLEATKTSWQWSVVALVSAACIIIIAWQLVARIKGQDSRSPTLLVDSEINMWMATGQRPQRVQQPGQEEPLFTQF